MNNCSFIGRISQDPEIFPTPAGNGVKFSIAVPSRVFKNGEWLEEVNFFDMNIFGKRAEGLYNSGHLAKGKKVAIEAEARQKRWTAKDGTRRQSVGFVVGDLQFC